MAPRRKRYRRIGSPPGIKGFRPFGVPGRSRELISLNFEEYEALQLADYKNMSQEDAARVMNVSRPTFTRIYDSCLKKIARAFAEGKAMIIEGGDVHFENEWYRCNKCHHVFSGEGLNHPECPECSSGDIEHINQTIRKWREEKYRTGTEEEPEYSEHYCVCPECRHTQLHQRGVPCYTLRCPGCQTPLIRKDA